MGTCVKINVLYLGDQVARKGTLTGGYYDPSRSRLRIQHEIYKLRRSLETTEAEKAEIREQVEHILPTIMLVHSDSKGSVLLS